MRATPDELLLAQKLINDLDKARAEVVVDIAVLEVSKNWERNLGICLARHRGVALPIRDDQHIHLGQHDRDRKLGSCIHCADHLPTWPI